MAFRGNTFNMYLKEIGNYKLLTAAEELDLAYQYKTGCNAQEQLKEQNDLSAEKIAELNELVALGTAAREKLINSNLRLVVSIAKSYNNEHLTLQDLVAEGNLGLLTAVEKYDPSLGYRFSTCATPWIRQAITKSICDKGRNIRIPAHIYQSLSKYRKVRDELTAQLNEIPTNAQIAAAMKITEDKLEQLLEWINGDTISLSTPLGDESDDTLEDLQADDHTPTPYEYTAAKARTKTIQKAFDKLPERSAIVIKMRYGLGGENDPAEFKKEHTLEEVGKYLKLTRERVRQIEKESLMSLKNILGDVSNI